MSLKDILKKSVYDQYISSNTEITVELLLWTLLIATLLAVFMIVVYKITYKGAVFSFEYATSLVLTTLVTSLVILPISYNLTLSLGMVGALSIIRFRTAVKNSKDISYMFWAIGIGIASGAGFYLIAIAGTAFIGIIMVLMMYASNLKFGSNPCIVIARIEKESDIEYIKQLFKKIEIKSIIINEDYMEVTAEIAHVPNEEQLSSMRNHPNISEISFVQYNGDYSV